MNPENIHPEANNVTNSSASYFTEKSVLDNIPATMLYLSAIYAVIFIFGLLVIVEAPSNVKKEEREKPKLIMRLKSAWKYMYQVACRENLPLPNNWCWSLVSLEDLFIYSKQ